MSVDPTFGSASVGWSRRQTGLCNRACPAHSGPGGSCCRKIQPNPLVRALNTHAPSTHITFGALGDDPRRCEASRHPDARGAGRAHPRGARMTRSTRVRATRPVRRAKLSRGPHGTLERAHRRDGAESPPAAMRPTGAASTDATQRRRPADPRPRTGLHARRLRVEQLGLDQQLVSRSGSQPTDAETVAPEHRGGSVELNARRPPRIARS